MSNFKLRTSNTKVNRSVITMFIKHSNELSNERAIRYIRIQANDAHFLLHSLLNAREYDFFQCKIQVLHIYIRNVSRLRKPDYNRLYF